MFTHFLMPKMTHEAVDVDDYGMSIVLMANSLLHDSYKLCESPRIAASVLESSSNTPGRWMAV